MFGPLNASTFNGPFSRRQREGSQCTPREGVTRRVCSGSGLVGGAAGRGTCRRCPPSASPYRTKVEKSRLNPVPNTRLQSTAQSKMAPRDSRPARSHKGNFLRTANGRSRARRGPRSRERSRVSRLRLRLRSLTHTLPSPAAAFPRSRVRDMFSPWLPTPSHPTLTSSFASVVDAARERAHIASRGSPPNTAPKSP